MADDPRHLLSGYAAEVLDDEERRRLMEAALTDQEVFDELVEEEGWRRILNAPGVRRELLEALDEPHPWWGFLDALRRPAVGWAVGTVAAALLAVTIVPYWLGPGPVEPGAEGAPSDTRGLTPAGEELVPKSYRPPDALTSKSTGGDELHLSYGLELREAEAYRPVAEDYRFQPGDQFRIRLETDFEARLYLFNRAAAEEVYAVVYPLSDEEGEPVRGEVVLPPGKNEWLTMDDTPEDEQLVLVIATAPWPAFAPGQPTVAYQELEVELGRAERDLESVSWRRLVADDRIRLTFAEPGADFVYMARLLSRQP